MNRIEKYGKDLSITELIAVDTGMDILCEILCAELFASLYPYQNTEWKDTIRSIVIAHELYNNREWKRARRHVVKDLRTHIKILMSKEGMRTIQQIYDRMGKMNQEWFNVVKEIKLK